MSQTEMLEKLRNAIINYNVEGAAEIAKKALDSGVDPVKAIQNGLAEGIREVGEKFKKKEIFLTELIMATETLNNALKAIKPEIRKRRKKTKSLGRVLIGTVAGDFHDVGKTIVAAMLTANGFEVIDLGVNVPTETFVKKVAELKPQILALSALLTTTLPAVKEVIAALEKAGLRDKIKIMVGGSPVTPQWAKEIGAEGYGADAMEAVEVAKKLVQTS